MPTLSRGHGTRQCNPNRRGLTLIEVVASTMIVGLMAVAALNALAAATKSSNSIGNRAVAAGLADELMSEIMMQSYSDPDGSPVFGHESGESTSVRSAFDDVDDYDGWNASPPQYRDGTVIPDRTRLATTSCRNVCDADEPDANLRHRSRRQANPRHDRIPKRRPRRPVRSSHEHRRQVINGIPSKQFAPHRRSLHRRPRQRDNHRAVGHVRADRATH